MGSAVYQLLKNKNFLSIMLLSFSCYRLFRPITLNNILEAPKKHPAGYIYLGNDNSLRDMLQASDRSPLEAVEKTICSSIDPVVKRSYVNCLNCNGKNFILWAIF